jgi:hypothetical protein
MKETLYRFFWMAIFVSFFLSGAKFMNQAQPWMKETQRQVLLLDAYEGYSDTGKPYWKGIFRDKELKTRFEWGIEPRTFREFTANNQPQDMIVTASRSEVNDPTTPSVKNGFGGGLIFLGIGGFLFNLIAVIFFRDPWRWN